MPWLGIFCILALFVVSFLKFSQVIAPELATAVRRVSRAPRCMLTLNHILVLALFGLTIHRLASWSSSQILRSSQSACIFPPLTSAAVLSVMHQGRRPKVILSVGTRR